MTLYFTKDHEWIRVWGDDVTVGISDHAQEALGDIVFAEVSAVGKTLAKGDEAAVVESVKAASDVYAPVSGSVTEGNQAVVDEPSLVKHGQVLRNRGRSQPEQFRDLADAQFSFEQSQQRTDAILVRQSFGNIHELAHIFIFRQRTKYK